MIIYRPHRGSLKDAMSEVREFSTWEELKEYVASTWNEIGYWRTEASDVTIKDNPMEDKRIGWKDTRTVLLTGYPVGFCATQYKPIEDF